MTAQRTYYKDGREIPEEEALNAEGIVKDGVTIHCPVFLQDGSGNFLVDGLGQPLPAQGRRSGFVFAADTRAERRLKIATFAEPN